MSKASNSSQAGESRTASEATASVTKRMKPSGAKVAIIVPFRDLDPKQHRAAHLSEFAPYMDKYLSDCDTLADYKVFVIQQSDDGRKFNRGKLLNIGFILAERDGFNTFIFHDVDLIPTEQLKYWYTTQPPAGNIAHVAQCWDRYNQSKTYLGGIVCFCGSDFRAIDGFPNLYWGWGGEDDELSKRVRELRLRITGPGKDLRGAVRDLERMDLKTKLDWLRANREVKCEMKWEVNDEHDKYRSSKDKPSWWGLSGLTQGGDHFTVLERDEARFKGCVIVTVDVGPNLNEDGSEHIVLQAINPTG